MGEDSAENLVLHRPQGSLRREEDPEVLSGTFHDFGSSVRSKQTLAEKGLPPPPIFQSAN